MASAAVAMPVVREELFELKKTGASSSPSTAPPRDPPSKARVSGTKKGVKSSALTSASRVAPVESAVASPAREEVLAAADEPPLLTGPTAALDDLASEDGAQTACLVEVPARQQSKLAPYKPGKMTVVLDMDECLLHSKFHGPGAATEAYRQCEERPDAVIELGVNSFWVALDDGDTAQVKFDLFDISLLMKLARSFLGEEGGQGGWRSRSSCKDMSTLRRWLGSEH